MAYRLRKPLTAYRIADSRFEIYSPVGAQTYGGRWNSAGRTVIYASLTYSGAMLETLVHANIGRRRPTHAYVVITIPRGTVIKEASPDELHGWDAPDMDVSRRYGDRWTDERRSAVLVVPSVIAATEKNVVINPVHPQASRITVSEEKPVRWDARLIRRLKPLGA